MDCCHKNKNAETESKLCPNCQKEGSGVVTLTLRTLLKTEVAKQLDESLNYRYCKSYGCAVAYFAPGKIYEVDDLKVKATHKDHSLDVPVCYCFNYTRESIKQNLTDREQSNVLNEIKDKMKEPGCFCEKSNPQGSCCLGNVSVWITECKSKMEKSKTE